jgi:hypothetical protein
MLYSEKIKFHIYYRLLKNILHEIVTILKKMSLRLKTTKLFYHRYMQRNARMLIETSH